MPVPVEALTEDEAREIEQRVITYQRALFSPMTSSVNPKEVIMAMKNNAEQEGVW